MKTSAACEKSWMQSELSRALVTETSQPARGLFTMEQKNTAVTHSSHGSPQPDQCHLSFVFKVHRVKKKNAWESGGSAAG